MIDKIRFKCDCDSISSGVCYCVAKDDSLDTYHVCLSDDPQGGYKRSYTGAPNTEKDIALEYIEWCWLQRDGWEWMAAQAGDIKIIVHNLMKDETKIFNYDIENEPCFYVKEIK